MTLHIGLIGCGAIGTKVATAILDGTISDARLTGIHTRTPEHARDFLTTVDPPEKIPVLPDPVATADHADIVVEAASQTVIESTAIPILNAGSDLLALSVGAFRDPILLDHTRHAADQHQTRVYVPSGAIAGLDGIAGLSAERLDAVTLTAHRPPDMLSPYVNDTDELTTLADGTTIFDGTARTAAAEFPAHMNIAIALTLVARVNPDDVTVKLILDRTAPRSRYVVTGSGPGGRIQTEIENVTTPMGPEATELVIQSTIATLQRLTEPILIGT